MNPHPTRGSGFTLVYLLPSSSSSCFYLLHAEQHAHEGVSHTFKMDENLEAISEEEEDVGDDHPTTSSSYAAHVDMAGIAADERVRTLSVRCRHIVQKREQELRLLEIQSDARMEEMRLKLEQARAQTYFFVGVVVCAGFVLLNRHKSNGR